MLTVVEVLLLVASFIAPLQTPKKKYDKIVDTNTSNAQYAICKDGYIVKL